MSYKLFAACLALVYANIIIIRLLFLPLTPWNVFYERQAMETFYEGRVPDYDALSYEGRRMTFVPGYFAAKAGFLHLASNASVLADLLFGTLVNMAFILSLCLLAKRLGMSFMQAIVFVLMISMSLFVFILLAGNLMHVLSLALLFFSLALMLDRNPLSGIALAASGIVHVFSILLFIIFALTVFVFRGERKIKIECFYPAIIASAVFLIVFLPTLLSAGIPTQAMPREWGYLLSWGITAVMDELMLATPLIIAALLFNRNKRFFVLLLLFVALYSFVSFRFNLAMVFAAALLLSSLDRKLLLISAAVIMLNIIPIVHITSGFAHPCDDVFLTEECSSAMQYVSQHRTPIIAGPIYGHILTYYGMPVVADPYVEYANEQRLRDTLEFDLKENITLAEKYNASAFSRGYACEGNANYDLVYNNGYLKFCRRW